MKAFFFDSQNISNKAVLAEIAVQHDFTADEARLILANPAEQAESEKDIAASLAKGVRSVPTFNVGGVIMGGGWEDQIAAAIARSVG